MPLQTAVHRRNGRFTFRLRVPARLVPVIHRQFLKRSLRTADPLRARLRGARLLGEARRLFALLELRAAMLSREEIEKLIRGFYAVTFEESQLSRFKDNLGIDDLETRLNAHAVDKHYLPTRLDDLTDKLELGLWGAADGELAKFKKLYGLDVAPGSRDEMLLRMYLMRALRQLAADEFAVLNGSYEGNVIDPLFRRPLPDPAEVRLQAKPMDGAPPPAVAPAPPVLAVAAQPGEPITGAGEGDVREIFQQAIAIAAAAGRVMCMAAKPDDRIALVPAVARGDLISKALLTIPELFAEFFERKTDAKRSDKTLDDYKRSLAAFVEIIGLKPVGLYRPADVDEFVRVLSKVPAYHRVKLGRDGPYRVAAELNEAADEKSRLKPMKAGTINNKYLTNVGHFFEWARTREMIAKNPAEGMQVEGPSGPPLKPRRPFTIPELQTIFEAPIFKGCKSVKQFMVKGDFQLYDHRRFVIPLALFSGCRLNELGQLRTTDVFEEAGRWWLRITTLPDPEDVEDAEELRKLKSLSAERIVPLHPTLIETFGFLDYVRALPPTKDRRVFPGWKKGADGYYSSRFSKWFNERLLSTKLGIKKPEIVFHSLRHNAKDALRRARVEVSIQNRLLGHADSHVGEQYGTPTLLPEEAERIDGISYPGLNLSHIKRYPAPDAKQSGPRSEDP